MSTSPSVARLVVAPSAPGLAVDLVKSVAYREALTTADLALTDSSFMVMNCRVIQGSRSCARCSTGPNSSSRAPCFG